MCVYVVSCVACSCAWPWCSSAAWPHPPGLCTCPAPPELTRPPPGTDCDTEPETTLSTRKSKRWIGFVFTLRTGCHNKAGNLSANCVLAGTKPDFSSVLWIQMHIWRFGSPTTASHLKLNKGRILNLDQRMDRFESDCGLEEMEGLSSTMLYHQHIDLS